MGTDVVLDCCLIRGIRVIRGRSLQCSIFCRLTLGRVVLMPLIVGGKWEGRGWRGERGSIGLVACPRGRGHATRSGAGSTSSRWKTGGRCRRAWAG